MLVKLVWTLYGTEVGDRNQSLEIVINARAI